MEKGWRRWRLYFSSCSYHHFTLSHLLFKFRRLTFLTNTFLNLLPENHQVFCLLFKFF